MEQGQVLPKFIKPYLKRTPHRYRVVFLFCLFVIISCMSKPDSKEKASIQQVCICFRGVDKSDSTANANGDIKEIILGSITSSNKILLDEFRNYKNWKNGEDYYVVRNATITLSFSNGENISFDAIIGRNMYMIEFKEKNITIYKFMPKKIHPIVDELKTKISKKEGC